MKRYGVFYWMAGYDGVLIGLLDGRLRRGMEWFYWMVDCGGVWSDLLEGRLWRRME